MKVERKADKNMKGRVIEGERERGRENRKGREDEEREMGGAAKEGSLTYPLRRQTCP